MSEEMCDNCNKYIDSLKIIHHKNFCLKFIKKCEICEEPINIEEMDDHFTDNHKQIECKDCGKKFERLLLSCHLKRCSLKPSKCTFCELEMPKNDLHDHEYMCGSKTEECVKCFKLIPIREMDLHIQYKCETFECKKTKYEDRCKPPIKAINKINDHKKIIIPSKSSFIKNSKHIRGKRMDDLIKTQDENYDYVNKRTSDEFDDDIINNILELSKHDK